MIKKENRILIILALLLIGIIIFVINKNKDNDVNSNNNTLSLTENKIEEFVEVLDDGTKVNTSTKLRETKTVEGLTVGNISFAYKNEKSQVIADVVNNTNSRTPLMEVTIILFDKNGKEISKMNGLIGKLEPGETTQLDMGTTADVSNAYDFIIVKK